jgi:hypothetical protein
MPGYGLGILGLGLPETISVVLMIVLMLGLSCLGQERKMR